MALSSSHRQLGTSFYSTSEEQRLDSLLRGGFRKTVGGLEEATFGTSFRGLEFNINSQQLSGPSLLGKKGK